MQKLTMPYFINKDRSLEGRKDTWLSFNTQGKDEFLSEIESYIYELEYKIPLYKGRNKKNLGRIVDKWSKFLAEVGEPVYIPEIAFSTKIDIRPSSAIISEPDASEATLQNREDIITKYLRESLSPLMTENKIDPQFSRPMSSSNPEIQRMIDEIYAR